LFELRVWRRREDFDGWKIYEKIEKFITFFKRVFFRG